MISVLMTTYNCAPYISLAIKSILNQTYKDLELLIIDDGSTDGTEEVVKKFTDTRIRYIKFEHQGRSSALNLGLEKAKYEIISIMDADDIAHPQKLGKQISQLSGKENEICFTDAVFFKNKKIKYINQNRFKENEINETLALHGHFTNSTFMFYKNFIIKYGGYNKSIEIGEDYDLWLRIKNKSNFIFVNEILQYQRIRENSLTSYNSEKTRTSIYNIQKSYYSDLKLSFNIADEKRQNEILGWREFFYGNKSFSRTYWGRIKFKHWGCNMFFAFILSFFPVSFVEKFNNQKVTLRMRYIFNRTVRKSGLDRVFKQILKDIA